MSGVTHTAGMSARERSILEDALGDAEPRLVVRTGTRVDTGRWLGRSRVWMCITDADVILLAAARRAHCERVARARCAGSYYCHTTGQLVLRPSESLRFGRLSMPPRQALAVLDTIENHDEAAGPTGAAETETTRA